MRLGRSCTVKGSIRGEVVVRSFKVLESGTSLPGEALSLCYDERSGGVVGQD